MCFLKNFQLSKKELSISNHIMTLVAIDVNALLVGLRVKAKLIQPLHSSAFRNLTRTAWWKLSVCGSKSFFTQSKNLAAVRFAFPFDLALWRTHSAALW